MGTKCAIAVIVVVGIIVLTVSLLVTSLKKLSSKEVGIQYDTINKDLDDTVMMEGLHAGPPGYEFIIFPNVFTTLNFPNIQCLDRDGVRIDLDVSYQIRGQLPYMRQMVMEFKDFEGYQEVLQNIGVAVMHESCSKFNTSQFQSHRGEFEDDLANVLKERYDELYCDVEGLQVNNIQWPKDFEAVIRSKERANEDIKVARQEEPKLILQAKTQRREALSEAQIIMDKAESSARIKQTLAGAEANAIREQYEKEAEAYQSIMGKDGLAFTPEGFISYLGVRVIADAKNPVYIGMSTPAKSSYIKTSVP